MGFNGRIRGITLVAGVTVALSHVPAAATEPYHYYYFKEQRPLTLNVDRVAVLRDAATVGAVAAAPDLSAYGMDAADAEALVITGWSLARAAPHIKTDTEIASVVRAAAEGADPSVRFVSPVFVGADGGPVIVTPDILVGFRREVHAAQAEAVLAEVGAGTVRDLDWGGMERAYRVRSPSRDGFEVLAVANRLAERPEVLFAEPDVIFTGWGHLIPNDTFFTSCWGLHNTGQSGGAVDADMDAPEAWDLMLGDPSIIVVIIDVGVEQDHPDINQRPGNDVTSDPSATGDPVNACDQHGTPVAGCVSAIINNNLGVAGVAPGCRSASVRTFISNPSCDGSWSTAVSWTVDALSWAQAIGARVTNNSNGYGFSSSSIAQKYQDTWNAGIVHFASAGNNASSTITYPSSIPIVNAVAALNRTGARASFSNFGNGLDFSAPGQEDASTDRTGAAGYVNGDYVIVNGTSFASPYTAGVAGLILSVNPALTAGGVESLLQQSSIDLGIPGYGTDFGWGFVNAFRAVQFALDPPDCPIAAAPAADPQGPKVRHLSFTAGAPGVTQAVRVTFQGLPTAFDYAEGRVMWVGPPTQYSENAGSRLPADAPPGTPTFYGATLQCSPHYADWTLYGLVHVFEPSIVPGGTYAVQAIDSSCLTTDEISYSAPLNQPTSRWGDAVSAFDAGSCSWGASDNAVNITTDSVALLDKFGNRPCAIVKARADFEPSLLDQKINITDVTRGIDAFRGLSYPFAGPPPTNPCTLE